MQVVWEGYSNIGGHAGSGVGSLPVSPPASEQTPGGSFPLTKKAALLGSLLQTREALQLVRSPVRRTDTDNSTEELSICGDKRCIYLCHLDYFHIIPSAVYPTLFCH